LKKSTWSEGQYSSLTFDKSHADQTIAFQHLENKETRLLCWSDLQRRKHNDADRIAKLDAIRKLPDEAARRTARLQMRDKGEFLVTRLALGRGRSKASFISLSDANGKERIQISVAADGTPKIQFLDDKGQVIYSLPEKK
jgi:hypothetical protein